MTATGDFLASVSIGVGGSWGRGATEEEALEKIAYSLRDWKGLFDILGKEIEVGLYDLTNNPDVIIDARGVMDSKTNEWLPMLRTAKVVVPTDEALEAKQLEKAQQYKTPAEVVAAYNDDNNDYLDYEIALKRLQELGLSERKADDMLLAAFQN